MKDIVIVFENKYIYKDKVYFSIFELKDKLKDFLKREIFIMNEEILIKDYFYEGKNIEGFIEETINKDFMGNKNLLYHYEEDRKNNKVYLYAIKRRGIEEIINLKSKVIPIQFLIKDIIIKNNRCNDFIAVVEINEKIYIIFVENRNLIKYEVIDDVNKIDEVLDEYKCKKIFIDLRRTNLDTKYLENKEEILKKINEKIYKKSRFFI